jgi:hypothetical protein
MKVLKGIIYYDASRRIIASDDKVFLSEDACLRYFQKRFPDKKHLRLKKLGYFSKRFALYNWTTPQLDYNEILKEVEFFA